VSIKHPFSKLKLVMMASIGIFLSVVVKNYTFGKESSFPKQPRMQKLSKELINKEHQKLKEKFAECCSSLTKHQISAKNALALKPTDTKVIYIDVREDNEQNVSMLPNSIKSSKVDFSQLDEKARYVVYCTIGYRSGKFVEKMRNKGFNAENLIGGIYGWTFEGGKIIDSKGQQTRNVHVYSKDWNFLRSDYHAEM